MRLILVEVVSVNWEQSIHAEEGQTARRIVILREIINGRNARGRWREDNNAGESRHSPRNETAALSHDSEPIFSVRQKQVRGIGADGSLISDAS